MKPLYLYGAGQHGAVVLDAVRQLYPDRACFFLDENKALHGQEVMGIKVVGDTAVLNDTLRPDVVVTIGLNYKRKAIMEQLYDMGCLLATIVHPRAYVAIGAELAEGCVLMPGAVVQAGSRLARGTVVNTNAVIEHHAELDEYVHVAGLAYVGAKAVLAEGAFVGSSACVRANQKVGAWSALGAKSMLTKDMPELSLWYGNPARHRKKITEQFNPFL